MGCCRQDHRPEWLCCNQDRGADLEPDFPPGRGRAIRIKVAAAINSVAEKHGLDLRVDPGTNAERGLPAPEPRLPRSVFRKPDTAYARNKLADLDRHRALRADRDKAAEKVRRDEADYETITRALLAKRAVMPSIAPPEPTLLGARLVEKCELAADFARLCGAPVAGLEVLQENTVFISCAGAEITVESGRAYVDGRLNEAVGDFLGELAADLGWEQVEVSGGAAPEEGAILRNSVRRMGRGLDPREFQISALHGDPDVDDALRICASAIGGSARPEQALAHFLATRQVTTSTQGVAAALLSGADLGNADLGALDFREIHRARLELSAIAVSQRAQTLKARNHVQLDTRHV